MITNILLAFSVLKHVQSLSVGFTAASLLLVTFIWPHPQLFLFSLFLFSVGLSYAAFPGELIDTEPQVADILSLL